MHVTAVHRCHRYSTKLVAQRCQWHNCDMHSGVNDTTVICTAVLLTPLWHAQRYHWHRCDIHSCVIVTAVICTAVSKTPLCNQLCRISSWSQSYIRKDFNQCIRGLGEVVWWKKTRGRKSRVGVTLRVQDRSERNLSRVFDRGDTVHKWASIFGFMDFQCLII
jgi:hypothetical protein